MSNKLSELKSLFIPGDILPAIMVILGLVIAVSVSEIAVTLIGISISILGIVVLLMKLTTRMSSAIDTKFKSNPAPNFKITVKKDSGAKRQVIEDFDESFEKDTKIAKKEESVSEAMGQDEGFRVISKKGKEENSEEVEDQDRDEKVEEKSNVEDKSVENKSNSEQINIEYEKDFDNLDEEEDFGMRIIGTKESSKEQSKEKEIKESEKVEEGSNYNKPNNFRKRDIEIPTQNLLEEMPILKDEPNKEFEFFINRILAAIRSVSNTRTAAFLLYNEHKNELILDSVSTDSKNIFEQRTRFLIGNDVVSQIVLNTKPEILSDISPAAELDLIPYYKEQSGTNSFIGLPVIYNQGVIGILAADSKHADAYDTVMVNFLGHFAKLISGLIRSYSDKYDLVQDSKILKVFDELNKFNLSKNTDEITEYILNVLKEIDSYERAGIILYDSDKKTWKLNDFKADSINNYHLNEDIEIDKTLTGRCISEKELTYIDKFENDALRVKKGENRLTDSYFLALPLKTNVSCYGCIFVEGKSTKRLNKSDVAIFEKISNQMAELLEKRYLLHLIETGVKTDPITGVLNNESISEEIKKEVKRVNKFDIQSSFIILKSDKYKSFEAEENMVNHKIKDHLLKTINKYQDELDSVGILSDDEFGILLSGRNLEASKLWSEKVRNEIAGKSFEINNKSYNITVSIGISELEKNQNIDSVINNTKKALNKSIEKSNTVSIYT